MSVMHETRREALVEAIRKSGMSVGLFAETYLARDQSTVYRWLSGECPVPRVVGNWLQNHAPKVIG